MRPLIFLSLFCLMLLGCCKEASMPAQPNGVKSPEMLWKVPLSNGNETSSIDPIVYKNLVVYTADDGDINKSKVVALDKETGKKVWEWVNQNEPSGRIRDCDSYLHNNILIVPISGQPSQIVAINLDNGTQL